MPDFFYDIEPPIIDTARWTPLLNEEDYLRGYFRYIKKAKSKGLPVSDSNLKRVRFFALAGLALSQQRKKLTNIAECGCFLGHSTYMISHILKTHDFSGTFHIFDSFEGLSDFRPEDLDPLTTKISSEDLQKVAPQNDRAKQRPFHGSEEVFHQMLDDFPFIETHRGWIPSKFHEVEHVEFDFVNLDLDIYEPTIRALNFFYPRLKPGGFIWLDDYGLDSWPGCEKAIQEFSKILKSEDHILKNPFAGLAIIKS